MVVDTSWFGKLNECAYDSSSSCCHITVTRHQHPHPRQSRPGWAQQWVILVDLLLLPHGQLAPPLGSHHSRARGRPSSRPRGWQPRLPPTLPVTGLAAVAVSTRYDRPSSWSQCPSWSTCTPVHGGPALLQVNHAPLGERDAGEATPNMQVTYPGES